MFNARQLKSILFAAALLLAAGCQQAEIVHSEEFAPDDQPKMIDRIMQTQYARGARSDATLYAVHFDGSNLNPLGMAKLDLMLRDDSAFPLAVWMSVPDDEKAQSRRMSVATYLKDHGVPPEQVTFGQGANPQTLHPAAEGLKDLDKMDQGGAAAAAPVLSTGGAGAGGGAGGGSQ
jgi:hypothetical protein